MNKVQTERLSYVPGSKVLILGMIIPPLIGNPYNGYISPYYWVDDHPLLYGNNGNLDPSDYLNHSPFATRQVQIVVVSRWAGASYK